MVDTFFVSIIDFEKANVSGEYNYLSEKFNGFFLKGKGVFYFCFSSFAVRIGGGYWWWGLLVG